MNRNCFLATLLVLCCALAAAPAMANSSAGGPDGQAAALYERGDYKAAYKQYLKLAKDGDTFSQYRLSYMSLKGLGTQADVVESMAWAVLAAEGEHATLDDYQSAVAAMVPDDQRKKAQRKADTFVRRWGQAGDSDWNSMSSRYAGGCTGTKLATNCGQAAGGGSVWIAWGADKSADPGQRQRIEELNRSIVEHAGELRVEPTGS
ncbi:MAG: hypothetical protein ACSLE2_04650 [Lysobacterales bacterium]